MPTTTVSVVGTNKLTMRVHPDDRKKRHHVKSRHGCISCKKRHLKCDEARPECSRCIKDFGRCDGYRTPRTWIFEPNADELVGAGSEPDSSSPNTSNTTSPSGADSSPVSSKTSVSSTSLDSEKLESASPEPEHTRQKRWAPKSRKGCLICKKRRIKCDEARPACSRCTASNRDCEYAPLAAEPETTTRSDLEVLELLQRKVDRFEDPDHPPPFKYVHSSPYRTQTEHQTFSHWQSRTESCTVISRNFGDFNILGCELPKAAWNFDCLKHGLLSAASVTASIERFSLGDYYERQAVIEAVKQSNLAIASIFREKPPPEVTVLVAFVFWFMEAWIGSWDRAVMHLASAARMCEQGFPTGQVSEAVAWYVGVCDVGVPQALKSPEILKYVQNLEEFSEEKFHVRLVWGTREAVTGIRLLNQARAKAREARPRDYADFNVLLATHQAQMRFMTARWKQYAKLQLTKIDPDWQVPPPPAVPMYDRAMEQIEYFINYDERFDALILAVRLKMIQRSLPLFIAGPNMEIRRDAAFSIPIKIDAIDSEPLLFDGDEELCSGRL